MNVCPPFIIFIFVPSGTRDMLLLESEDPSFSSPGVDDSEESHVGSKNHFSFKAGNTSYNSSVTK